MKKKLVSIMIMSLSSFAVQALGLGEMKVHSFLNQPFDGEIELTDLGNAHLESIKADIASMEDFERMGMERANVLSFLSFDVEKNKFGRPIIRIRSSERITEPYLQILVDLAWATGQVYRSYTILLDPPAYQLVTVKQHNVTVSSDKELAEQPAVLDKSVQSEVNHDPKSIDAMDDDLTYGPTRANETIWQIAQRYQKDDVLLQQMILAIVGTNPDAFAESNLNGLKENSRLNIPTTTLAKTIPAEQAKLEVFAHDSAWQSKQPIEHVLFPPYTNAQAGDEMMNETLQPEQPLVSTIPPVPKFSDAGAPNNYHNFATYLPKAASTLSNATEHNAAIDQQTLQQAKFKAEMDLAISAIGSVRDANNVLKEQLKIAQAENNRLFAELKKRDQKLAQLQKEIRIIKSRQGLAAQVSQETYETDGRVWPWILILLLLAASGAGAYWWFWLRPNVAEDKPVEEKKPTIEEPPHPVFPPLTPLENPVMTPQEVSLPTPTIEETTIIKEELPVVNEKPVIEPIEEEDEIVESNNESHLIEFEEQLSDNAIINEEPIEDIKEEFPQPVEEATALTFTLEETGDEVDKEPGLTVEEEPGLTLEESGLSLEEDPSLEEAEPSLEFKPEPVNVDAVPESAPPVKSQKALDTLLDLAKTYISMGDQEAAHQSLEEVLKHGSETQKREAEELLKKLGSN